MVILTDIDVLYWKGLDPGAPLTYFNDGGVFGSMKDAGIFWGRENNAGIFLGIVFFISSNQQ